MKTKRATDEIERTIDRLVREVVSAEERDDAESAAFHLRALRSAIRDSERQ